MAISDMHGPHHPGSSSSYGASTTESAQSSSLFLNVDSSEVSIGFGVFGDSPSSTPTAAALLSTWADSDSSFAPAASLFGLEDSDDHHIVEPPDQLGYPATEEDLDMLLADATVWMSQPPLSVVAVQPVMHPVLVRTLKTMVTPADRQLSWGSAPVQSSSSSGHDHDPPPPPLSPPSSSEYSSLITTSHVEATTLADQLDSDGQIIIQHEPPPLNMKRLERAEEEGGIVLENHEDGVEAAEVSVALIQNRRPWQCGLAGCNKTFKNPQTMKMHHKKHYTDGSAVTEDGVLALLPTLTPSLLKAGQNKKIPSRCPKCRKTFVGLYELRRHYGRKHSEFEKPFGCRKCDKKFYIEVDVRDHEKLCGESIECRCGLKFAFKCNLVAHKKAHPACQDRDHNQITYVVTSSQSTTPSTTSDEDSVSPDYPIFPIRGSSITTTGKRRHHHHGGGGGNQPGELKNYPPSKHGKYSYCGAGVSPTGSTPVGPGSTDKGGGGASMTTFKAAYYDFAGLQFATEGSASVSSNMHYPSTGTVGSLPPSSVTWPSGGVVYNSSGVLVGGGLEQLGSQIYNSRRMHRV